MLIALYVRDRIEIYRRVGIRAPGPHLGGDPDGLHDLLGRGSVLHGRLRVAANAVRALSHMRHGASAYDRAAAVDCGWSSGTRPLAMDMGRKGIPVFSMNARMSASACA